MLSNILTLLLTAFYSSACSSMFSAIYSMNICHWIKLSESSRLATNTRASSCSSRFQTKLFSTSSRQGAALRCPQLNGLPSFLLHVGQVMSRVNPCCWCYRFPLPVLDGILAGGLSSAAAWKPVLLSASFSFLSFTKDFVKDFSVLFQIWTWNTSHRYYISKNKYYV